MRQHIQNCIPEIKNSEMINYETGEFNYMYVIGDIWPPDEMVRQVPY
jgi:hypothetical protein